MKISHWLFHFRFRQPTSPSSIGLQQHGCSRLALRVHILHSRGVSLIKRQRSAASQHRAATCLCRILFLALWVARCSLLARHHTGTLSVVIGSFLVVSCMGIVLVSYWSLNDVTLVSCRCLAGIFLATLLVLIGSLLVAHMGMCMQGSDCGPQLEPSP